MYQSGRGEGWARSLHHISRCIKRGTTTTIWQAMCGIFAPAPLSTINEINRLQFGFGIAINESSRRLCRFARSSRLRFETTIQRPVEARGIGLHSGVPVSIRVLPAPVSTGIVFVRTDLDNFPISASWRHVARVRDRKSVV